MPSQTILPQRTEALYPLKDYFFHVSQARIKTVLRGRLQRAICWRKNPPYSVGFFTLRLTQKHRVTCEDALWPSPWSHGRVSFFTNETPVCERLVFPAHIVKPRLLKTALASHSLIPVVRYLSAKPTLTPQLRHFRCSDSKKSVVIRLPFTLSKMLHGCCVSTGKGAARAQCC